MQPHLNLEEIARLVDEVPTPDEAQHLSECDSCATELQAMRDQSRELAALSDPIVPTHHWPIIKSRLADEGLLVEPAINRLARRNAWLRVAAAVLLFVAGGVTSQALQAAGTSSPVLPQSQPATVAVAETPQEIAALVKQTESAYLEALTQYALIAGEEQMSDPINRLAALEGIVYTTRAALQESPADPIINGYHLAAMSQRDALLKQIDGMSTVETVETTDEWF